MAESCVCWGHEERAARGNKIRKLFESHLQNPDENMRVLQLSLSSRGIHGGAYFLDISG